MGLTIRIKIPTDIATSIITIVQRNFHFSLQLRNSHCLRRPSMILSPGNGGNLIVGVNWCSVSCSRLRKRLAPIGTKPFCSAKQTQCPTMDTQTDLLYANLNTTLPNPLHNTHTSTQAHVRAHRNRKGIANCHRTRITPR